MFFIKKAKEEGGFIPSRPASKWSVLTTCGRCDPLAILHSTSLLESEDEGVGDVRWRSGRLDGSQVLLRGLSLFVVV